MVAKEVGGYGYDGRQYLGRRKCSIMAAVEKLDRTAGHKNWEIEKQKIDTGS